MFNTKVMVQKLKSYRKRNKIKQMDFAKKIGVSAPTLSRWEHGSGNFNPKLSQLLSMADVLGITPSELFLQEGAAVEEASVKTEKTAKRTGRTTRTKAAAKTATRKTAQAAARTTAKATSKTAARTMSKTATKAASKPASRRNAVVDADTGRTSPRKRGRPRKTPAR